MSVPMVNLRPLLAATEPEWRANLQRMFERSQFILGEQVAAFEHELWLCFFAGLARQRWADRSLPVAKGPATVRAFTERMAEAALDSERVDLVT